MYMYPEVLNFLTQRRPGHEFETLRDEEGAYAPAHTYIYIYIYRYIYINMYVYLYIYIDI